MNDSHENEKEWWGTERGIERNAVERWMKEIDHPINGTKEKSAYWFWLKMRAICDWENRFVSMKLSEFYWVKDLELAFVVHARLWIKNCVEKSFMFDIFSCLTA